MICTTKQHAGLHQAACTTLAFALAALTGCTTESDGADPLSMLGAGEEIGPLGDQEATLEEYREALSDVLGYDEEPALESVMDPQQRERAMERLDLRGFDASEAEFFVHRGSAVVRIEGVSMRVEDLLGMGAMTRSAAGDELIAKGYRVAANPPVGDAWADDIRLIPGWGADAFTFTLAQAGARQWSEATWGIRSDNGADIDISFFNSGSDGSDTTVYVIPDTWWHLTPCKIDEVGCGEYPSGTRPGSYVYIRSRNINCTWTVERLYWVVIHEIGHTIGFAHPGKRTHVEGTAIGDGEPTVMAGGQQCSNAPLFNLSSDDRHTVTTVY